MLIHYVNNDSDYETWCKDNRAGYVFNNFGGNVNRADMNKVHKVSCFVHIYGGRLMKENEQQSMKRYVLLTLIN